MPAQWNFLPFVVVVVAYNGIVVVVVVDGRGRGVVGNFRLILLLLIV